MSEDMTCNTIHRKKFNRGFSLLVKQDEESDEDEESFDF